MERNAEDFAAKYEKVYQDMFRFALYTLKNRHEAEDVVSETVLDAWKGIEGLKDENAFRAWIFRILANKCRQKLKSYLNRAVELPADLAWRERDTSEDMDVRAAFYKLNDEERLILSSSLFGGYTGKDGVPRLSVLDVQKQIRSIPKPVIAAVNGFAIGGGHVLHVVCDLSIASENAIFGQTGPRVGSFDAGFGASYLARVVGQKKAREIWFLCRKYNAQEALDMGLVNKVVPLEQLEDEYVQWAEEMMLLSPLALRMIKAGLNAELDGQAGIQELAGDATLLYYLTDEAQEGKNAFLEKRKPNFKQYPKFP